MRRGGSASLPRGRTGIAGEYQNLFFSLFLSSVRTLNYWERRGDGGALSRPSLSLVYVALTYSRFFVPTCKDRTGQDHAQVES